MTNFHGNVRSNYFKVKDVEAFKAAMHPDIQVSEQRGDGCISLLSSGELGWLYRDWNPFKAIAPHLDDDEWCVLQSVGGAMPSYLIGHAFAFDATGQAIELGIDDIYKQLPDHVSLCVG
jgi:hypothetical protein